MKDLLVLSTVVAVSAAFGASKPVPTPTPSGTGLDRLVLTVLDIPKALKPCGSEADLQKWTTDRFAGEKGAPKLGKGGDPTLPLLEIWVESRNESPRLFSGIDVPEGMTALVPRMRITTFVLPEEGSGGKPSPEIAFEGNAIWWGNSADCPDGLKKAVGALLDRFFNEYWRVRRK